MQEVRLSVSGRAVTASLHGAGATALVLGHGAGGDRRTPLLLRCAEAVAASGRSVLLHNFPYSESRRRLPDPPELLEETTRAAVQAAASLGAARLVAGGKSMGGRIASQAVASGTRVDGLVFLGYPLHAPGRPERLRDRHLGAVDAPMLFLQGTRDAFARWDLIEAVATRLGERATLVRLEDADHSFRVPKRGGRDGRQVEAGLFREIVSWLEARGL